MNLKLRLKNKVTLSTLLLAFLAFIYQVLGAFGIIPPVAEETWEQLIGIVLNILVAFGILVDPTTKGAKDSKEVLEYTEPRDSREV